MSIESFCSRYDACCRSFDEDVFIASVSDDAVLEIHHGDHLVTSQQLARYVFTGNALAFGDVDGDPCIVVATRGKGSGVYIHRALTGQLVRSLPFRDDVYSVCIDRSGTLVVFGTQSGLWVSMTRLISRYRVVQAWLCAGT